MAWLRRNFFGFWPPRVLRSAGVATSRFLAAALFYRAVWPPSTKTLPEALQPNWGVQLQRKIWPISKSNSGWQPKKIHLQPKVRAAIRQKSQKVISGGSGPVLELLLFVLLRFLLFPVCLFVFADFASFFAVSCSPVCFCRFCFVFAVWLFLPVFFRFFIFFSFFVISALPGPQFIWEGGDIYDLEAAELESVSRFSGSKLVELIFGPWRESNLRPFERGEI